MKHTLALIALAATMATAAVGAHAQTATPEQRAAAKERFKDMTPEERAEAKARVKARWDAMSPEEQAAAKQRRAEKRQRLGDKGAAADTK